MKITKRKLRRIIKETLAGGMGHIPVPDPAMYDLGKDDGSAGEKMDPKYEGNASYRLGHKDGQDEVAGGRR